MTDQPVHVDPRVIQDLRDSHDRIPQGHPARQDLALLISTYAPQYRDPLTPEELRRLMGWM